VSKRGRVLVDLQILHSFVAIQVVLFAFMLEDMLIFLAQK